MIDSSGPDVCTACKREWVVKQIQVHVKGDKPVTVRNYWCRNCDSLEEK